MLQTLNDTYRPSSLLGLSLSSKGDADGDVFRLNSESELETPAGSVVLLTCMYLEVIQVITKLILIHVTRENKRRR